MSHAPGRRDGAGATARHRVVVTAGHVDHGKSTLVRALTGMEPDRLEEERRRGLTIELGFAWTHLSPTEADPEGQTVAFVDVPGHERFIGTMLAGAGAAPAAVLCVAADDGWARQSSEHRDVLDLLGIPAALTVITKADTVAPDRLATVRGQVERELAGTSLVSGPIVETDALTGRGLDELRRVLAGRLQELPEPEDVGRPRLWLDRAFTIGGAGTVVTGTLTEGALRTGDRIRLLPDDQPRRIRGLRSLGDEVDVAAPGTRLAVNVAGLDLGEVDRGRALVADGPWRCTTEADLWVRVLPEGPLDRAGTWRLHVGTAAVGCRLRLLAGPVEAGLEGAVRVTLDRPLPLVAGDRVVLREVGRRVIVAGGSVVDPLPRGGLRGGDRRRRAEALARTAAEVPANPARIVALVELAGGSRDAEEARAAAGVPDGAPTAAGLVQVGDHLVTEAVLARWTARIRDLGGGGQDRAALADRLAAEGAPASVAPAVVDHLLATGELVQVSGGVALPEHAAAVEDRSQERVEALVAALAEDPFAPPALDEVARELGVDLRQRAALLSSGRIVRCGDITFAAVAIDRAVSLLSELEARNGPFTTSEARQALGTTRRFAVALLEHLDRRGLTDFDGHTRRVRR
jgi:selenocysteine-specific elongation factor